MAGVGGGGDVAWRGGGGRSALFLTSAVGGGFAFSSGYL